jgi:hypothetical protein
MPYTPKTWQDSPSTSTPISAAALQDLEARGAAYADTVSGPIFAAKGYGVKADGVTVTDAAITSGSNLLSSVSAGFTALADVGKIVTVVAAGSPTTTTTTAGLTSGVGFTALAVNALPAAILPGGVKITSGANSQWVTTTGAAAGATSIPLIGLSITAIGTALSTGAAITTIAVPALQAAVPAGTITLVNVQGSGGAINFQTFSTTGAAIGATTIPVTSATPNFAYPAGTQIFSNPISVLANFSYPIGSTVSSPTPSLVGYIGSVAGGVASLVTTSGGSTALNAGTTISGGEAVFGTDDYTNAMACITAAGAAKGIALFPYGQICLSNALATSDQVTIEGLGVHELYGGTDNTNTANMPTIAPYLQGTVFVVMPHDMDCFQLSALGRSQHTKRFGIRFATKFYRTGDGIDRSPSLAQLGIIGGVLEDVRVFGHDGNHYGDIMDSQELCRCVGFRSYGGGGMWLRTNALTTVGGPPGNLTCVDQYSITSVGGVAHNFLIDTSASQYLDYCQFINPEHIVSAPNPAFPNSSPPTTAQQCVQTYYSTARAAALGYLAMGFVGPVCESNIGSKATFPWGTACYRTNDPIATGGNPLLTTAPASGTGYQNKTGSFKQGYHVFTFAPAAAAPNSTTLSAQANAGVTALTVTSATGFAAGQAIQIDTGSSAEFAIISSVAGTTLNLVQSSVFGLSTTHLNGVAVTNGHAAVIGQWSNSGVFPGSGKPGWYAAAVGSQPSMNTVVLPIPSGAYYRLDYSTNTSRMWTEYLSTTG